MPQTKTQVQTQEKIKVIETLKELKKSLPLDVWKFRKLVEQKLNCELYYDEVSEPRRGLDITKNIKIYIYDVEYVDIVCNEEIIKLEFRNSIYVDDLKTNMIYLIHYEVGA